MKKLTLVFASLLLGSSLLLTHSAKAASASDVLQNKSNPNQTTQVCDFVGFFAGCSGSSKAQCDSITDPDPKTQADRIQTCKDNADKLSAPGGFLSFLLDTLVFIGAIISVIFIIVGGIRYVTSSGDAKRIQQAKDTVLYAVIGLIVSILAGAIVGFVISSAGG
jgi:hypothetical protein